MSDPQANKEAFRRQVDQAWNQGDHTVTNEIIAIEYVGHANFRRIRGPKGMTIWVENFREAFSNLQFTIEDLLADGDKVVARMTLQGTHTGDFMYMRPTNRKLTASGVVIMRFEAGHIVEGWFEWNYLGLLQQIGATWKRTE